MRLPRLPSGWSRPGQTRSRLVALSTVAALPIALMAATIVWQDYREVARGAEERAAMVSGQVLAELRSQIAIAGGAAVAAAALAAASHCPAAPAQPPPRLYVFGPDGHRRCEWHSPPPETGGLPSWFNRAGQGAPFTLGLAGRNGPFIVAAPIGNGAVAAKLLPPAWLRLAMPLELAGNRAAAWLIDDRQLITSSVGDMTDALPSIPVLTALLTGQRPLVRGMSATHRLYAYAAADVLGGWHLVVAVDAEPEHRRAIQVLLLRAAELGVLVLVGLAAVVFAADVAFGAPLRRLSDGVSGWRAGAVFSPGDLTGAPDEVRHLAHSFAEATAGLRDKEAALARAQQQQTHLLLEVHHRVKNNLQIVASLLNLQANRIRVPEARAEFQAARDRVRALATLHRHLYADGDLHTIDMRSFLAELCGELFQALGETEGERIKLSIEAPELRISSDEAVPLALIVTEIISNSVKYAFPGGRAGSISVQLTEAGTMLDLVVSDDGVGIDTADRASREREGIGLRLVRGFTRQLGATLEVAHGNGTRYGLRLSRRTLNQPLRSEALDDAVPTAENSAR